MTVYRVSAKCYHLPYKVTLQWITVQTDITCVMATRPKSLDLHNVGLTCQLIRPSLVVTVTTTTNVSSITVLWCCNVRHYLCSALEVLGPVSDNIFRMYCVQYFRNALCSGQWPNCKWHAGLLGSVNSQWFYWTAARFAWYAGTFTLILTTQVQMDFARLCVKSRQQLH